MAADKKLKKIESDARKAVEQAVHVASPLESFLAPVEELEKQVRGIRRTYAEQLVALEESVLRGLEQEFGIENVQDSSGKYLLSPGKIEITSGRLPNGAGLVVSYSGVPQRSFISRAFGSGNREITLQTVMNAGEEDIRFPDLTLNLPESHDPDFERKVSEHLSSIALRAAEEMLINGENGDTEQNLREIAYFEGRLVARVGRLIGSRSLAGSYAKVKARSFMANKLSKFGADYEAGAEIARQQLDEAIAAVRTHADEVKSQFEQRLAMLDEEARRYGDSQIQAIDSARDTTLAQLGAYAEQRKPIIEEEITREAKQLKQALEKEAEGLRGEIGKLKKELEERKGPVTEAVVYFADRLGEIFRDYNPEGTQYDVDDGVRHKYAGELAKAMGKDNIRLGREEIVSVLTALASNVQMSGHRSFNAGDVKALVGETVWIAQRVGGDYVGQVVERISEAGKKGRSRAPLQTVHSVLENLF